MNRDNLLLRRAGDASELGLERRNGCAAGVFDADFGAWAQRFPCNFASRAGIPEEKWSHAPLHEVSHRTSAIGIGARGRAQACGRRISTGRMLPSLHSEQRSDGLGCGCLVSAASRTLGACASSSVRHKRILSWRRRLARKPKWRIFTKPRGNTWNRKRRMNSVACSVKPKGC